MWDMGASNGTRNLVFLHYPSSRPNALLYCAFYSKFLNGVSRTTLQLLCTGVTTLQNDSSSPEAQEKIMKKDPGSKFLSTARLLFIVFLSLVSTSRIVYHSFKHNSQQMNSPNYSMLWGLDWSVVGSLVPIDFFFPSLIYFGPRLGSRAKKRPRQRAACNCYC
jgi:hypothetical protein